jgi:lipopolysaccharide transport system ATP-binding protein
MDTVIKVDHLSKQYRIGAREGYKTFRETLVDAAKAPFARLSGAFGARSKDQRAESKSDNSQPNGSSSNLYALSSTLSSHRDDWIWALKDVSFEVKQGEVLGIIGRNGAGKSTLLKILSKITEPTEGRVELRGRVGSLLEVGTGFHPELTGHENIYLYGAILGMDRWEVTRKFDEIVAFAELEKFIDTPVKRYSSGMYMRLAFAVAAHLEPEILLVDEVLAVGDAGFQKKCLGKMDEVARGNRTIIFVSHQMNAIRKLCERCLWLDSGCIQMQDKMVDVVNAYEKAMTTSDSQQETRNGDHTVPARFIGWEIVEPKSDQTNLLTTANQMIFKISLKMNKETQNSHHGIALWNNDGQLMWAWAIDNLHLYTGISEFVYELPGLPLRPGIYHWQASLYEDGRLLDNWYCLPELVIAAKPEGHRLDEWNGILNLPCTFQIKHSGFVEN